MPYNAVSDRRYSGINILTLWNAIVTRGFATHAFLTFRQAIALGGSVRRGERGIGVIYTRRFTPREEQHRAEVEARAPTGGIPFLKFFTVFKSEEHTSELQSLMRISYAVFCLKKKKQKYDQPLETHNPK